MTFNFLILACTSSYCAIDHHVATRVRRFLVERHWVSSHGIAVFWLELRRIRQDPGHCVERILPESGVDILHAVLVGQGPLYGRRPAAFERKLIGHENCAGGNHEQPDEPVCSDIRDRFF
jgi:hypothetical protein